MTDATPGPGSRRSGRQMLVLGLIVVVAVGVGIGGGSLLARAAGSGPSASPTDVAVVPTISPSTVPTPSPTPTPEPTPALVPAPLTGLLVPESSVLQHPIAAMIDDHPDARPQSGFNAADVVWQAPAEGGIPRYMMVFQSHLPASLGPIRSARQYFIEWAAELHAMYVHLGGSGQAQATLAAKGHGQLVFNADGLRFDGSDMYRVKTRFAPHNVYTDDRHLLAMARAVGVTNGPVSPIWSFAPPVPGESRPVGTTITVNYPTETITYHYDPVSNTYPRFIGRSKTQQVDAGDGMPVAPTNVVILRMRFGPLNDGHPEKHRLEAADVGTGQAIISTNGRIVVGTWKKAAVDAPTLLFGPDGKPFSLTPGQTFVQVLALSYTYSVTPGTVPGFRIHEQ